MEEEIGGDRDDENHPEQVRNAKKIAARKTGERVVGDRNGRAIGDEQADAAQGRQARQGHNEGRQAELHDAESMEQANAEPDRQRGEDRQPDRNILAEQ